MLVLTRHPGEGLVIELNGQVVTVVVDRIDGGRVRFLIDAPVEIEIEKLKKVEAVKKAGA